MSASRAFVKGLPFDRRNFVPATTIAETPFIVTVAGSSPIKSVDELIKSLRAKGVKNRYGTNNPANVVLVPRPRITAPIIGHFLNGSVVEGGVWGDRRPVL